MKKMFLSILCLSAMLVACHVKAYDEELSDKDVVAEEDFGAVRQKAIKGDGRSQYLIALVFLFGTSYNEQSVSKGEDWLLKAVESGNTDAMLLSGKLLCEGQLVEKNEEAGKAIVIESFKRGNKGAEKYLLGKGYSKNDLADILNQGKGKTDINVNDGDGKDKTAIDKKDARVIDQNIFRDPKYASLKNLLQNYDKDVPPLKGFGKIPWGVDVLTTAALAELPTFQAVDYNTNFVNNTKFVYSPADFNSMIAKTLASLDDKSAKMEVKKLSGICVSAPINGHIEGQKESKTFTYYFVDSKLMGLTIVYDKQVDYLTTLRAMRMKYGNPKLYAKRLESKEINLSGLQVNYVVFEFENDAGVARVVFGDIGAEMTKILNERMKRARAANEIGPTDSGIDGTTANTLTGAGSRLNNQIVDDIFAQLEKCVPVNTENVQMLQSSYYSKELKKYAEANLLKYTKLRDDARVVDPKEKAKEEKAKALLKDI